MKFQLVALLILGGMTLLRMPTFAQDHEPSAKTNDIRVMSFNIRYGTARDGENHWSKRKEFVVETILANAPDVLGTQENLPFQADYLAENLPGYGRYGKGRQEDGSGERCEIYWKTNRFALVESGTFMLSEFPDVHGTKSWDSSLPRIASWVRLKGVPHAEEEEDAPPPRAFLFINTHFDHRGKVAREKSAQLVRNQAEALGVGVPIVLTGDMNFGPDAPGYRTLAAKPWLDTYRVMHPDPKLGEGTFSGFRGRTDKKRIDYVFSRGVEVTAAAIDRRERDGRNPSDHFPVTATLRWQSD